MPPSLVIYGHMAAILEKKTKNQKLTALIARFYPGHFKSVKSTTFNLPVNPINVPQEKPHP